MDKLERMDDFFAARTEGYDEHMLEEVEGCKEGYAEMARLVPKNIKNLLDLGCGTGLELDRIFEIYPDIFVTGIDLTASMLEKLRQKHPDKSLELICGDYFTVGFKNNFYDCAVSFQTMHHFSHDKKITLYKKIYDSLTADGIYIECDYMAETQEQEDFFFAENARLRREQGIGADEFYHYDTPCTFETQIKLLEKAGFLSVKHVFRLGATSIIVAKKHYENDQNF